jgi:hypothetical protein
MDKQLKALFDSLRCPVCGAQIDLAGKGISRQYNYCCADNNNEYVLHISELSITHDRAIIYDRNNKYIIVQNYDVKQTIFDILKVDAEGNITDWNNKTVYLDYTLFDYQNTDKEKIIRRLKTVMTFG